MSTTSWTVAALAAGLMISGGARAEDWKPVGEFGAMAVGKAYEIEKGHFFWVGDYGGTFISDKGEKGLFDHAGVKCPAWADNDFNTKKAQLAGYCVITDADGDQAYVTWRSAGATGPGASLPGTFEFTGGTGKYAGIKGDNTFVGHTSINWPDGTATGFATWNR